MSQQKDLGQYPTPVWVAEALVERHFSDLDRHDLVLEPSCGPGAFLTAIPEHVPAMGVEIDARMAALARQHTGRTIVKGDFCSVPLDVQPTLILGNPPFKLGLIDRFLNRAHALLPEEGRVGFILPAYAFQTAARVAGYNDRWSLMQEMIPRNIYPGLKLPLVFAMFSKDRRRTLVGFALYRETADVNSLAAPFREALAAGGGPVWVTVVETALRQMGGRAKVSDLYATIEGKRPTQTQFWKEKVRQTLRRYGDRFRAEGQGVYALVA